jgi:hypothetical protein
LRLLASDTLIVFASSSRETSSPDPERQMRRAGLDAVSRSSCGTSPCAHQQPLQIGRETKPDSNSIHTPAWGGGIAYRPFPVPA